MKSASDEAGPAFVELVYKPYRPVGGDSTFFSLFPVYQDCVACFPPHGGEVRGPRDDKGEYPQEPFNNATWPWGLLLLVFKCILGRHGEGVKKSAALIAHRSWVAVAMVREPGASNNPPDPH
eukprot:240986-Pelagomonas_calceolata.AAC.1